MLRVVMKEEDFLSERSRAEDILLGSLGFVEGAQIIDVQLTPEGYRGTARWSDGEEFSFSWEEGLDDLQRWALNIFGAQSVPQH